MKKVWKAIILATLYLFIHNLTPYIGMPDQVIIVLFFLSPFVITCMVCIILKDGKPSKNRFDERFYDDLDYSRLIDSGVDIGLPFYGKLPDIGCFESGKK